MKVLLTGQPGCGKTTVVMRTIALLETYRPVGFYTEEVREEGRRIGFDVVALDGERATLAREAHAGVPRIDGYLVNLPSFEGLALEALSSPDASLYVIDEIGKMECLSVRFIARVRHLLSAQVRLLGTVALNAYGLATEIRKNKDYTVLEVTHDNRDALPAQIARLFA